MGYDNQAANSIIQLYKDRQHDISPAQDMATLYGQREVQFMGIWTFSEWRLKIYGIPFGRSQVRKALVEATYQLVPIQLPDFNTKGVPGVGFVVIHDAEDAGFVLIEMCLAGVTGDWKYSGGGVSYDIGGLFRGNWEKFWRDDLRLKDTRTFKLF